MVLTRQIVVRMRALELVRKNKIESDRRREAGLGGLRGDGQENGRIRGIENRSLCSAGTDEKAGGWRRKISSGKASVRTCKNTYSGACRVGGRVLVGGRTSSYVADGASWNCIEEARCAFGADNAQPAFCVGPCKAHPGARPLQGSWQPWSRLHGYWTAVGPRCSHLCSCGAAEVPP